MAEDTREPIVEVAPPEREIRIRCICPDPATHPDGDVITFPERLDFPRMAVLNRTIRYEKSMRPKMTVPESLALLAELYLRHTLEAWTVVGPDAKGKIRPIPIDQEAIETYLLSQPDVALDVAERANDLFDKVVLGPLVQRAKPSSETTSTGNGTSPSRPSGAAPTRKRSSRSSISTIPTAAIGPTG